MELYSRSSGSIFINTSHFGYFQIKKLDDWLQAARLDMKESVELQIITDQVIDFA